MTIYSIIVNPRSGSGRAREICRTVEAALHKAGREFQVHTTNGPGHATELARNAPEGIVVAVGGDGTVNEIVNGLMTSRKVLAVIPAGSGNDFIKCIGVSRSTEHACRVLLRGHLKPVDVGCVEFPGASTRRYFVNGMGVGFDSSVANEVRSITRLPGILRYLVAVLKTLGKYQAPEYELVIDGQKRLEKFLLIAVGNGPCAGGGFYLTPDAQCDDGLLDVCTITDLSVPGILRIMPSVMRGKHGNNSHVRLGKAQLISVLVPDGSEFFTHIDGEVRAVGKAGIRISLLEKSLNVIAEK